MFSIRNKSFAIQNGVGRVTCPVPPIAPPADRARAALSADRLRDLMSTVCGPVVVITTLLPPQPVGTTVSSFVSLSLRPPLVLVALDRTSRLLPKVAAARRFGVNVLRAGQEDLGRRFAAKDDDKFAGVDWTVRSGLPRLAGTVGWAACTVTSLLPGGDHVIVIGEVEETDASPGASLVYGARRFGRHSTVS